jgi:hypothetical protein
MRGGTDLYQHCHRVPRPSDVQGLHHHGGRSRVGQWDRRVPGMRDGTGVGRSVELDKHVGTMVISPHSIQSQFDQLWGVIEQYRAARGGAPPTPPTPGGGGPIDPTAAVQRLCDHYWFSSQPTAGGAGHGRARLWGRGSRQVRRNAGFRRQLRVLPFHRQVIHAHVYGAHILPHVLHALRATWPTPTEDSRRTRSTPVSHE